MNDVLNIPLLVVAGFPRTGTTSIYRNLELHPGFAVPVRKELDFFRQPDGSLAEYVAHFPRHDRGEICVDVSPLYSLDPAVPGRLRAAVPHVHVILLIREPAGWIQSAYAQMCKYSPEPPTFERFLENPALRLFNREIAFSLKDGVYQQSLSAFARAFGDNLLVIDFAAFEGDPLTILKEIETFAGAPSFFTAEKIDARAHNSSNHVNRSPQLLNLLSQERVVRAASKIVPAPVLRRARYMFYYSRGAKSSNQADPAAEHNFTIARDATVVDLEVYRELFRTSRLRRGSDCQL